MLSLNCQNFHYLSLKLNFDVYDVRKVNDLNRSRSVTHNFSKILFPLFSIRLQVYKLSKSTAEITNTKLLHANNNETLKDIRKFHAEMMMRKIIII